jgi:hypothetical protein
MIQQDETAKYASFSATDIMLKNQRYPLQHRHTMYHRGKSHRAQNVRHFVGIWELRCQIQTLKRQAPMLNSRYLSRRSLTTRSTDSIQPVSWPVRIPGPRGRMATAPSKLSASISHYSSRPRTKLPGSRRKRWPQHEPPGGSRTRAGRSERTGPDFGPASSLIR